MDSSRLLDSARDPYARRQAPSMALPTSLSSGQPYYTVESLEGASSLPLLKPDFAPSASLPSERDAILRLDAQTRALLADRETLDARARLLAAEREALLRRSVPGPSLADRRAYAEPVEARTRLDGLPPADARTRLDVLPPVDVRTKPSLDDLQPFDPRARVLPHGFDGLPVDVRTRPSLDDFQPFDPRARVLPHGLDGPPHDALRLGLGDRGRAPAARGALEFGAQEHRSLLEVIHNRELAAVSRSGTVPVFPSVDSLQSRRDIADVRTATMPPESSLRRRDFADVRTPAKPLDSSLRRRDVASWPSASSFRPQSERPRFKESRETAAPRPAPLRPAPLRPAPAEAARKQNKSLTNVKSPIENSKTKPPPEQSEGWCALCKVDCHNIKTLGMHVNGKKHKAMVEGDSVKAKEDSEARKPIPVVTTQADRKRASEAKPETFQKAKRSKMTSPSTTGNGTAIVDAAGAKKGKVDDFKKEKAKKPVVENGKDSSSKLVCEVCNITTTGQKNLESHLKGKRHAARLKELADS